MTVKKTSHAGKGSYAAYRNTFRFGKNKIRKLEKHLKKFPEDAIAAAALDASKRGIIESSRWGSKDAGALSASDRLHAQLTSNARAAMNQLGAHCDKNPDGGVNNSELWVLGGQLTKVKQVAAKAA